MEERTVADAIVRITKVYQRACTDNYRPSRFLNSAENAEALYDIYLSLAEQRERGPASYRWLLDGAVKIKMTMHGILVTGPQGQMAVLQLQPTLGEREAGEITLDGQWFDFGDDTPAIWGLFDAAYGLAPGETVELAAGE